MSNKKIHVGDVVWFGVGSRRRAYVVYKSDPRANRLGIVSMDERALHLNVHPSMVK